MKHARYPITMKQAKKTHKDKWGYYPQNAFDVIRTVVYEDQNLTVYLQGENGRIILTHISKS
jgi:hypothetical protein